MAGTELRNVGTTATGAPVIKRGVATFSDGRTVSLFIDSNFNNASGTDVTNVPKIVLYISNDVSRTTFTLAANYTPPVAPSSNVRFARASMTVAADNSVWVAWQGVDNSLNVTRWSYAAGVLTFVANEVVQAAGAITDRFRSIDIDIVGNATAAVAVYEARTATGDGAFHRVYVRSNAATWVRAVSLTALAAGQFIRTSSEDITIAWRGDGVVSNVGRFLLWSTKTYTTADLGDLLREYSYNVSTAPADGGVILGTWSSALHKDQAAGTRRGMIFTLSSTVYLFSGVIGAGVPKFIAAKLTTGLYGAPVWSTAGYVSTISLSNYFKIDTAGNARTYVSMAYKDNRLIFGFAGVGTSAAPRIFREVSMSWTNVGSTSAKPTIDAIPRPLDSAYYPEAATVTNSGPLAIYGGDNRRTQANLKYYNFLTFNGRISNTVNSVGAWLRKLRFVSEDTFDAPALISPYNVEPTSRPVYRVRVENVNLQPNLYGKIEVQVASDTLFTTSVKTITQPDSAYQYFGSQDGLTGTIKQVAVPTANASQALTQGTWYWRARIVSDKDTPGAWTGSQSFTVSHPPVAAPIYPTPASTIPDIASNNYTFSWQRSDTDPNDTQTAYRVIVRRKDTLANVVDTGIVASGANVATINFDVNALGILELPLDWQVQLNDADGVTGPLSTPVEFVIGDQPVLDLVSPDGVSPMTTALPEISWTFAGFGGRVQRAYRITLFSNETPNLITNPSFESGMTGWQGVDGTAIQSSDQEKRGSFSAFITPNGTGASPRVEAQVINQPAVVPGQQLYIEGWIRPTTANKPILLGINWFDAGGVYLSTSSITASALAGTWQKLTLTATAPPLAAKAAAHAGVGGTPAVGDTVYVDQLRMSLPPVNADNSVITTNWRVGTETSYTFTTQVLMDGLDYGVTLEVQDSGGLVTEITEYFTTDWIEPALAAGMAVTAPDPFKVRVAWTNAAQDPDFVAYRVYRRYMKTAIEAFDIEDTKNVWFLMFETSDQLANYVFDDYLAPLNREVEYIVVQLADRFGSLIESNVSVGTKITLVADRYYFVPQVLLGGIASFEATAVTGDNFNRDVEQETLHVVGRGRQVQVGDDLGYSGTLTIKNRNPATARRDREFFEIISSQYNAVYMKNPFGDVVLIALGVVSSTRQAGYGGSADFVDISVPYTQIIDEELTPRQPTEA